ncbi:nucleotidyl transferase AbiEii/AbiGii toxin family protein [Gemmatimonadota bacterium]
MGILAEANRPDQAHNLAREYLHVRILQGLQRCGAMVPLAFHGGTALRLLYRTPRFSEGLDFALERPEEGPFELKSCVERIQRLLDREGYKVLTTVDGDQTVQKAWIRFAGLPYELGLSSHPTQHLAVKIEVDTRPPAGAGLATTLIRRFVPLHLQHHDRPSLLAGKIAAVLLRSWTKGRDLFDLFWYLGDRDWPDPNVLLLANAFRQQGDPEADIVGESWIEMLLQKISTLDWRAVHNDVSPFLERPESAELFTQQNLLRLLEQRRDREEDSLGGTIRR